MQLFQRSIRMGFLVAVWWLAVFPSHGQAPSFDDQQWDSLRQELVYEGTPPAPATRWQIGPIDGLVKWLMIGVLVIAVGFLLWHMRRMGWIGIPHSREHTDFIGEEQPDQLETIDFLPLIRQAEAEGRLIEAMRLHFLYALQQLNQHHHIQYQRDKTNRIYAAELRSKTALHQAFRSLLKLYEPVRYGDRPLSEAQYGSAVDQFQSFRALIPQQPHE